MAYNGFNFYHGANIMKKILIIIIVLLLLLSAIALSSLNAEPSVLNLHWHQVSWPLGFLLLLFSVLGVLAGLFLTLIFWLLPAKSSYRKLQKKYRLLEKEHQQLKKTENPVLVE